MVTTLGPVPAAPEAVMSTTIEVLVDEITFVVTPERFTETATPDRILFPRIVALTVVPCCTNDGVILKIEMAGGTGVVTVRQSAKVLETKLPVLPTVTFRSPAVAPTSAKTVAISKEALEY
jgi:hypothetical protein